MNLFYQSKDGIVSISILSKSPVSFLDFYEANQSVNF